MRRLSLATLLVLGCPQRSGAPHPVVTPPVVTSPAEEDPQPPLRPRPPMRIADAEPDGVEQKCRPERRTACLQAKAYPDERLQWELDVRPTCEARNCAAGVAEPAIVAVVAALLEHGAYDVHVRNRRSVSALVSYAEVIAAAQLDAVVRIDVECTDSAFCSCADLPVERCPEHAFCAPVTAFRIDGDCIPRRSEVIGCMPRATICEGTMGDALAPDGSAWRVGSSCMPSQPGWQLAPQMTERRPCDEG